MSGSAIIGFGKLTFMGKSYAVGDWVVYKANKQSTSPGPRAKNIHPSERGELYSYQVDKYWAVAELKAPGQLVLKTRRGKTHVIDVDDICLRKARWWEKLFLRERFPQLGAFDSAPMTAGKEPTPR